MQVLTGPRVDIQLHHISYNIDASFHQLREEPYQRSGKRTKSGISIIILENVF